MPHYIDIKVIPDAEFDAQTLLNVLFNKLHLMLVNESNEDMGISFPAYSKEKNRLGNIIRIHSSKDKLDNIYTQNWVKGIRDYIEISAVTKVPNSTKFRTITRQQFKSNPEKERRRLIKRKKISEEEALKLIPDNNAKKTKLPYIEMKSLSSNQRFKLFIKHSEIKDQSVDGKFSKYGLSSTATIPWF